MNFKKCFASGFVCLFFSCRMPVNADDYAADVYQTGQLNAKQETKTVNIISVLPAKVAVDNTANKKPLRPSAQFLGL